MIYRRILILKIVLFVSEYIGRLLCCGDFSFSLAVFMLLFMKKQKEGVPDSLFTACKVQLRRVWDDAHEFPCVYW